MTHFIFFVWRGYNDFDHMLPLIHHLQDIKRKDFKINVVFTHLSIFFPRRDARYKYINNNPSIKVVHSEEIMVQHLVLISSLY